jgi:hypothetical protein
LITRLFADDHQRFGPGDCVLCEDLAGKGHLARSLPGHRVSPTFDVPDDWELPAP